LLGPAFAASRVQHLSDLHSKFALGPHHVSKYGRHPICGLSDLARKKKKKIERNYRMKILWSALLHRATIISLNTKP